MRKISPHSFFHWLLLWGFVVVAFHFRNLSITWLSGEFHIFTCLWLAEHPTLVDVFNQIWKKIQPVFLQVLFFFSSTIFSFLSFWDSNYMHVEGLDIMPQVTEALCIVLLSSLSSSGWRISVDVSINSLFLYFLYQIHAISFIE